MAFETRFRLTIEYDTSSKRHTKVSTADHFQSFSQAVEHSQLVLDVEKTGPWQQSKDGKTFVWDNKKTEIRCTIEEFEFDLGTPVVSISGAIDTNALLQG